MPDIIAIELKSDLEHVYKVTGDLLTEIEALDIKNCGSLPDELLGRIKAGLMDTGAVLQKDIFNCDFIITRLKTDPEGKHQGTLT